MEVTVEDKIRQAPEWDAAVLGANKLLEEVVRNSTAPAKADWSLVWYKDRFPAFLLRLSDDLGATAEARLGLEELRNGQLLRDRLNWLWGDVLQERSHKLLARLKETVSNLTEG